MSRAPSGLTHRQERFCRAFAEGANATRAAYIAGYTSRWVDNQGYRLLRQPRIRARIAAIQAEMAREACETGAVLMGKLEIVFRRALESNQFPAAMRAVDLQTRLALRLAGGAGAGPAAVAADQAVDPQGGAGKMTKNDEVVSGPAGKSRFFLRTCRI